MEIGKLSNEQLDRIIFSKIKYKDERVLVGSGIGEDCSILDFKDELCVISSDPITATTSNMGKLAVYISCNDIASKGIKPFGIMVTLLAPPTATLEDIQKIMEDILQVSNELQIELLGGHTEITDAVNRIVLSVTSLGGGSRDYLIPGEKVQCGDLLVMTKYAGLEGTTILYDDFKNQIEGLTEKDLEELQYLSSSLSVIQEGLIGAQIGVKSMHDATEGGILGAAWEMAEKSKLGVQIVAQNIPILETTKKITSQFHINPFKLISSGVMLMIVSKEKEEALLKSLQENNINGAVIGEFIKGESKIITEDGQLLPLDAPETDELYKAYKGRW
ncbi:hydrogenase maturation carbamoyl dehydratase HypE [Alkalibaculum bacchi]|uniref:Hydrogenase maturation carbamoyl dehydratase HypE n=1 Tax=Alkalibaculum bacchi TaxID=645887 RepID=A0A366IGP3_9FIRM|nr:AIR synthase family protein [Alkalibaculum bacchi]RBP69990.1 hydrogenase maturation carbamoyl dehydratase HypE [Alkalibaculum bacchi]